MLNKVDGISAEWLDPPLLMLSTLHLPSRLVSFFLRAHGNTKSHSDCTEFGSSPLIVHSGSGVMAEGGQAGAIRWSSVGLSLFLLQPVCVRQPTETETGCNANLA
ncbi:hypothetical protein K437DRAFT_136722 [Tilletiaria anomala UBC 951]|uniref:Uncharacterized protein n=1 Tax=Tilletiaria anomala (strain ATCC 24038 / CBS 436.72 / UBC 951) TaxID=1037660 RepID=A0A066W189_TILAU|nr:uncharacterized protein K437DRAFT_136722 [Tilletiaria anomala UBC 951]KDN44560.1 hypothetical protein K437DRAFT_136722 [Tilletiaria anomala UBC 951]